MSESKKKTWIGQDHSEFYQDQLPKYEKGDRVGILYFGKESIHALGTVVDSFYLPEREETYWFIDEDYQIMGGQTIYIVERDWQKPYGVGATLVDEQGLKLIEKSA